MLQLSYVAAKLTTACFLFAQNGGHGHRGQYFAEWAVEKSSLVLYVENLGTVISHENYRFRELITNICCSWADLSIKGHLDT